MSAHTGDGIDELWSTIEEHRSVLEEAGALEAQRNAQAERWMWSLVEERLMDAFRGHPDVAAELAAVVEAVRAGERPASEAAEALLTRFLGERRSGT